MSAQELLRINLHPEAQVFTQRAQSIYIPLRFMSEMEVVTFVNFARVQRSGEHISGEVMRRHHRQITREWQHQYCIDLGFLQQLQLERERCKQLGGNVGSQNAEGMRLEGDDDGLASDGVC